MTDNTYTKDEVFLFEYVNSCSSIMSFNSFKTLTKTLFAVKVLKMESDVLKSLNFEISNPTAKTFLRQYIQEACCSSISLFFY